MENEEEVKPEFDIRVTHRDRSGAVVRQDPYNLIIGAGPEGGKTRYWERPKNSGNIFDRQGRPCGRYLRDEKTGKGKYLHGEPHVAVITPLTQEELLMKKSVDQAEKIRVLEMELASVKRDAEPKKAELKSKAQVKADEV